MGLLSERAKNVLLSVLGSPETRDEVLDVMGDSTSFQETIETTDDTVIDAVSIALDDNSVYDIEVSVLGYRTDADDADDVVSIKRRACVSRKNGGSAAIAGSVEEVGTDIDTLTGTDCDIDVDGNNALVTIAGPAQAAAELEIQDLTYVAATPGAAGNEISIEYVDGGTAGDEVVTVNYDNEISVLMEDGVSTADDILAAIEASGAASYLVTVTVTGTGSNAQDEEALAPLADGEDHDYTFKASVKVSKLSV